MRRGTDLRGRFLEADPHADDQGRLPVLERWWGAALLLALCAAGLGVASSVLQAVLLWGLSFFVVLRLNAWLAPWHRLAVRVEGDDLRIGPRRVGAAAIQRVIATSVWAPIGEHHGSWKPGVVLTEPSSTHFLQTVDDADAEVVAAQVREALGWPVDADEPVVTGLYDAGGRCCVDRHGLEDAGLLVRHDGDEVELRLVGSRWRVSADEVVDLLSIVDLRSDPGAWGDPERPGVALEERSGRVWHLAVGRRAAAAVVGAALEQAIRQMQRDHAVSEAERSALAAVGARSVQGVRSE